MLDLIIIGAGPSGLYAGYLAHTQKLSCVILEATDEVGGQIKLYQDKPIYDMASYKEILGSDFIKNLHEQLTNHQTSSIVFNQEVIDIQGTYPHFKVITKTDIFESKHIILASGGGLLSPKTLEIEDEDTYTNIHYVIKEAKTFEHKKLAIFGGGDTAIDWAHYFMQKGSHVSLIHRRDTFRAQEHLLDDLKQGAKIYTSYQLETFHGHPNIKHVEIKHLKTDDIISIEVDDVMVFYGNKPSQSLRNLPLETREKGYQVSTTMQTSLEGVYAIGNMASYEGKVAMIITGLGEAATAIGDITSKLNPKKKMSYGSMT